MVNRTSTADLLKGIAAILMIQVHVIELFATHDIFKSNLGQLLLFLGGPAVAPVFMIIFGYFIAGSKKSTSQLILRGAKIIILGILLNLALNFNLILSVNKGLLEIDILPYIFGIDILALAGLSIMIIALLKKAFDKGFVLIIPFILISAFMGKFLLEYTAEQPFSQYVLSLFYGASWWSYFPLFPWLAYSLTGILFYKIQQNYDLNSLNKPKIKIILGACFLLFLAITIQYAITISADLPSYYHHGLIFFLWVISFLFFYSFFINEIDKIFGSGILFLYLKWLGKNITIVYIIQWIIIGNIATEIYKTVSNPLHLLLWFASVLFISSGICYSWIKIKEMLIMKQFSN